jgi:heptosyltransferase-2
MEINQTPDNFDQFARDCIYFKGDKPCMPYVQCGASCKCELYSPRGMKILVIMLSSAADVIRTTALLKRYKAEKPDSHIILMTDYPELLQSHGNESFANEVMRPDAASIVAMQMEDIGLLINLDTDKRACALVNLIPAKVKKGFYFLEGFCHPADQYALGVYQQILEPPQQASGKQTSRIRAFFQIADLEYHNESTVLAPPLFCDDLLKYEGVVVGIHTATSTTHHSVKEKPFWETLRWAKVCEVLHSDGMMPVLIGNDALDRYNKEIARQCECIYLGGQSLAEIITTINHCDIVITTQGVVQEVAVALGKQVVLLHGRANHPLEIEQTMDNYVYIDGATLAEILPDVVVCGVEQQLKHLSLAGQISPIEKTMITTVSKARNYFKENRVPPVI